VVRRGAGNPKFTSVGAQISSEVDDAV